MVGWNVPVFLLLFAIALHVPPAHPPFKLGSFKWLSLKVIYCLFYYCGPLLARSFHYDPCLVFVSFVRACNLGSIFPFLLCCTITTFCNEGQAVWLNLTWLPVVCDNFLIHSCCSSQKKETKTWVFSSKELKINTYQLSLHLLYFLHRYHSQIPHHPHELNLKFKMSVNQSRYSFTHYYVSLDKK